MSLRRTRAWFLCGALLYVPGAGRADGAGAASASTALAEGELRAYRDELGSSDPRTREQALAALSTLSEDALATITARIEAMRGVFEGGAVAATIARWREVAGATASLNKLTPSLLKALGARPDRNTLAAVEWLAYLSALEAQRSPEAAEIVVGKLLALDRTLASAEGPLSFERLGVVAIPALLRGRVHPRPWLRALCAAGLVAAGYDVPGRAVQQDDAHLLAAILQVYGDVLAFDAMAVTVSYVVDERSQVRDAAQRSVHRFARNAIWQLRERYLNVVGKDAPADWTYARVLDELLREHSAPQRAIHTQALKFAHEALDRGDAAGALNALNPALLLDATDERGVELSALLFAIGERALNAHDTVRARESFARAIRVDPEGVDVGRVQARLAFLEAERLASGGFLDLGRYEAARERDPEFAPAQRAVDELSGKAEAREAWLRRLVAGFAGLLLAAGAAFWLRASRPFVMPACDAVEPSD